MPRVFNSLEKEDIISSVVNTLVSLVDLFCRRMSHIGMSEMFAHSHVSCLVIISCNDSLRFVFLRVLTGWEPSKLVTILMSPLPCTCSSGNVCRAMLSIHFIHIPYKCILRKSSINTLVLFFWIVTGPIVQFGIFAKLSPLSILYHFCCRCMQASKEHILNKHVGKVDPSKELLPHRIRILDFSTHSQDSIDRVSVIS